MSTPTDGPLDPFGAGDPVTFHGPLAPVLELWARPVRDLFPVVNATADKPIGQLTMKELLSWVALFGYLAATGALIGTMAGNVARVAIRGR